MTNYQQLIIGLARFFPALAATNPMLLDGYASRPSVQLIKTSDGQLNIRIQVPPANLKSFLVNYGVTNLGSRFEQIMNLAPNALIELDRLAQGQVTVLVRDSGNELEDLYPMDTSIACYQEHHQHLQMVVRLDIANDSVIDYSYYSRNRTEDFCINNVYIFKDNQCQGIATETWYAGGPNWHKFNLSGVNVYKSEMSGSHRDDYSRIYLNITPPANAEPIV